MNKKLIKSNIIMALIAIVAIALIYLVPGFDLVVMILGTVFIIGDIVLDAKHKKLTKKDVVVELVIAAILLVLIGVFCFHVGGFPG